MAIRHTPSTRAGTTHSMTFDVQVPPGPYLSGASIVTLRSGCHSPNSKSCETTRDPGLSSASIFERSEAIMFGSR